MSLFFAAAGQDHDATGMQNLSYTKALRKQKWRGDAQTWKIQALYPSVESSPQMKKRNGDDANPFNLSGKSMRGVDTESLIGCSWKQWSGCQEYHGKSIDPYQGRSQAENQWVPRLAFRPVRDRLSLRSFIKRQLRPIFLCSQTSTHGPKRGFGKNSTLPPLVVNLT